MSATRIAIIDAQSGNIPNVVRAFQFIGHDTVVLSNSRDFTRHSYDRLVLPGVGSFGAVVQGLNGGGWFDALKNWIRDGQAFLGICVGLQVLLTGSDESPHSSGIGITEGNIIRFDSVDGLDPEAKVPHIGWNQVNWLQAPLRLDEGYAYFVHSYYAPAEIQGVVGKTHYKGIEFASALSVGKRGLAVQFHPEKSGLWGLELLHRFAGNSAWI